MTLDLTVDAAGDEPPYQQIRTQIARQVADGELPPGTKLPTVRALAETLGIAPNTVARAYRELEHSGVVSTRGRNGTVVTPATKAAIGDHDENVSYEAVVGDIGAEAAARLRDLTLEVYARAEALARERGIILADTSSSSVPGWRRRRSCSATRCSPRTPAATGRPTTGCPVAHQAVVRQADRA